MARGALYVMMGLLALGVAVRIGGGQTTDLTGCLVLMVGNPYGKLVLTAFAIGLAAYSLWRFVRAVYDPLHRGSDTSGYAARLGFVTSAVSYAAIVIFALQLLTGSGGAADSTQKWIASILTHPAGGPLTPLIGLIALVIGIAQFVEAYRATFKADLKAAEMSDSEKQMAVGFGRFGMAAGV